MEITGDIREALAAQERKLRSLKREQIEALVAEDKCPFDPSVYRGMNLGMFPCPLCGETVVAGSLHPRNPTAETAAAIRAITGARANEPDVIDDNMRAAITELRDAVRRMRVAADAVLRACDKFVT